MDEITNKILDFVLPKDYEKGLNYDEDYIDYVGKVNVMSEIRHNFLVRSERINKRYVVYINIKNNEIESASCTCEQFNATFSCKHIAACLITYSDELFKSVTKSKNNIEKTKDLFQKLKEKFSEEVTIKKEVKLIPYLTIENNYYYDSINLKVKIGIDKLYSLLSKFNGFERALEERMEYPFGTSFVYDPEKHFLSKESRELIKLISNYKIRHYYTGNYLSLNSQEIKDLLKIYHKININESPEDSPIVNEFPMHFSLHLSNGQYTLVSLDNINNLYNLTDDYEYIYYNNIIYHLNPKQQFLLNEFKNNSLDEMIFSEKEFYDFQKSLLRIIKGKITLDETTNDLIIGNNPDTKLYFDLNEDSIICNPKFVYDEDISYFDKESQVIRDIDYEEKVVKELEELGFVKKDNALILCDLDLICDFMDNMINELSEKYMVFTTENFKNTHIIKDNKITTHFSIGQDEILRYEFDLGGISNDELDNILLSMQENKKYYRLKSGDILSLDQDSLNEIKDLTQELELSNKDIKEGHGEIPKYRALYLDSLKEKKYNIIETDSLFQKFINQFKEFQNNDLEFTKDEQKLLRDYQVSGVKWLYTICKCGFGGILADEMGLGKSLQTIIFIEKLLKEDSDSKFLIVCPTSLVYNWENEFHKFAPHLKYQVFAGQRSERRNKLENFHGNIYITSYGLLREDEEFYQDKVFKVFAIDEAQNIKNPHAGLSMAVKNIKAETKLALTGAPIENSIVELWSIFDFIMPGFLSSLVRFQKKYKVKDFDEDTNKLLKSLKEQVKPFILRRKKNDVIKDLPPKIENNIYIDLNPLQKKYYAAEVKLVNDKMNDLITNSGFTKNKMLIITLLTRLRQICIDPHILYKNYEEESAKLENLIKIIKEVISNGHKILLFSSFKTALDIVEQKFSKENISSYMISGDVPAKKRQMLVDAFNKDKTNVFLIMLKSGGTGLNLTSADVVIHLDMWWNPQAENQATDRTHRIGQTKTVEVIKLICKGTIEEKILALQEKKKVLSDKIIEEDMDNDKFLQNLTEQDIRDLLAYENKD